MSRIKDLTGKYYGEWFVLSNKGKSKAGKAMWLCRCKCGTEKVIVSGSLLSGKSLMCRSCSASKEGNISRLKAMPPGNLSHGMASTRFYNIWSGMVKRCGNNGHKDYFGRGIKVCKEWLEFTAFYADMYSTYSKDLTIDRIDNDGNYTPSNCKWSTMQEQARNTRRNRVIQYQSKTKTLVEWCEELQLSYGMVKKRLLSGWTIKRAFEKAPMKNQFI